MRAFAWLGALLFLASLLFCGFTYLDTMGPANVGGKAADASGARAILFDIGLFTAFALHHSVFARDGVRALVQRLAGRGLERSVYVWIASLMLGAVCLLWRPVPGTAWHVDGLGAIALRGVQLAGVWVTIRSAAVINVLELAGVRQAQSYRGACGVERESSTTNHEPRSTTEPQEFKTAGPYGWVRHPIYTGWFAMVFGEPEMTMTRLVFAAVSGVYLVIAIPLEERSIRAAAGAAYGRYMQQVRWKLVPGVY